MSTVILTQISGELLPHLVHGQGLSVQLSMLRLKLGLRLRGIRDRGYRRSLSAQWIPGYPGPAASGPQQTR